MSIIRVAEFRTVHGDLQELINSWLERHGNPYVVSVEYDVHIGDKNIVSSALVVYRHEGAEESEETIGELLNSHFENMSELIGSKEETHAQSRRTL